MIHAKVQNNVVDLGDNIDAATLYTACRGDSNTLIAEGTAVLVRLGQDDPEIPEKIIQTYVDILKGELNVSG